MSRLEEIRTRRQARLDNDETCGAANALYDETGECATCDFYSAASGDVLWLIAEVERLRGVMQGEVDDIRQDEFAYPAWQVADELEAALQEGK